MIRPAIVVDAAAICRIYNHYVRHTIVTFEEQAVAIDEMGQRISNVVSANLPWLVLEDATGVVGYAYASKWRERSAYRYSVESTVYIDVSVTGKGYGSLLYTQLLADLRSRPVHAVLGCVALPNDASVALHEKCWFINVANFAQVGRKCDQWIDVGYWQLLL